MSKHFGFRMVMLAFLLTEILGCDPFESDDRTGVEDLPDDLYPFLPEHFDPAAFRSYEAAPSLYGHYWSGEMCQGLDILARMPAEQVLTLHFEDFLTDFDRTATRLITFIDPSLMNEEWLQTVRQTIHPVRSAWEMLPQQEQDFLQAACEPGMSRLAAFEQACVSQCEISVP